MSIRRRNLVLLDGDQEDIEESDGVEREEEVELDEEEQQKVDDGEICSNCGATFAEAQGVESLCSDCYKQMTPAERDELPESKSSTLL